MNRAKLVPSRAGLQALPLAVVIALFAGGLWFAAGRLGWLRAEATQQVQGVAVRRGPLRISVTERGNLKAADSVVLKSEIERQTTILYLIPEGTRVEEGELLCELDATELIDRRFEEEISVRNAEAAYIKSKQNYEIQESQNTSDIAQAEQSLEFALQDLNKFQDEQGEKTSQLADAEEGIALATEEFKRAEDKLEWSERLAEKGFLTATELEADRLSRSRAEIELEQSRRQLKLLEKFLLPRQESELRAGLEEAQRELDRVKLQAKARIVDYEADMRTNEAKLTLERENLARLEAQIAKAKLYAPRAGMVVYAKQDGGRRWGDSEPIQEGTQVRERQEIITIPSAAGMVAQASLHESVLKQVEVGQRCIVKVDALRGQEFRGRVSFVAVLPDQGSWWANPNMRLYRTDIEVVGTHPEMRPGMSCAIEVLVEDIPDAIHVPVQSVFRHRGENIAFVVAGPRHETRTVEVGRYNDRWVEILSGLEEGEIVLLSPPKGFTPEAGEEPVLPLTGEEEDEPPGPPLPPQGAGRDGPQGMRPGEQRGPGGDVFDRAARQSGPSGDGQGGRPRREGGSEGPRGRPGEGASPEGAPRRSAERSAPGGGSAAGGAAGAAESEPTTDS